ncbi:hypothetical protein WA556_006581 [Blastocystis sp. ATCC 50177/Nand II]
MNLALVIVGIAMTGATLYYSGKNTIMTQLDKYVGCGVGLITTLFPLILVCGGYKSRGYVILNNCIMAVLGIAVTDSALLYFDPVKSNEMKKALNLPMGVAISMLSSPSFHSWVDAHLLIVGIAIGSFASLLFLTVLLGILYAYHTRVINRGPFTVSQKDDSYWGHIHVMEALIAAQYNHVKVYYCNFKVVKTTYPQSLLSMNLKSTLPALKTIEDTTIKTPSIAQYIASLERHSNLMGQKRRHYSEVMKWSQRCTKELAPAISSWLDITSGRVPFNKEQQTKNKRTILSFLDTLDEWLVNHTFLVGERITLADISMACQLLYPMEFLVDPYQRTSFHSVMRWFLTCVNQPQFKVVMGQVQLCQTPLKPVPYVEKKAPKEKKEEKPVEETPKKPAKNPLELLPPTTLDLDNWKRVYSNTHSDFYSVMDTFWAMYDAAGWSLWFCDYMYNDENKKGFMTANLVSGFIQRCDELRKYAFGNMSILKGENDAFFTIKGAWLMRGDSIQPMLDANPDSASYTWKKVDIHNEADKKELADLWCASETIDGKEINSNEVFK